MENPTQTFKEKPCASARIVCIGVSPPPPRALSCQAPSLNRQTIQAPFFIQISQTEKNIFAYKLFLSLNISGFIFYVKIATLSKKGHSPLSQKPPSKNILM